MKTKLFRTKKVYICICRPFDKFWCTIADVKITFPDDIDDDIEAIRELLADADEKESSK